MTTSKTTFSTRDNLFPLVSSWRRSLLYPALLVTAVVLCYLNSLHVPFVFDDYNSIVDNPRIESPSQLLTQSPLRQPRVLVDLTFALNRAVGGDGVVGYHVVNTAVHAVNALLVYALTLTLLSALKKHRRWTPAENIPADAFALVSALVFACHPIQTQAVTYIVQRYTSMAAMFYMGSVLFFLHGRLAWKAAHPSEQTESTGRVFRGLGPLFFFALSGLFGAPAFLSKQNSASLPGMILLVEYVVFDRSWRGWARKALVALPVIALFAAFVLYSMRGTSLWSDFGRLLEDADRATRETAAVDRWTYAITQLRVLCIYLGLLIFPIRQCLDWAYPFTSSFFSGWTPVAALMLLGIVAAGFFNLRRNPLMSLAVGWFFIALSVESSFFPIRDALFEHRLYLPSVGFCWIAAEMLCWVMERNRTAGVVLTVAVLTALGTATHLRNRVWQNPARLWLEAVQRNPLNGRAHNNLGKALMDLGDNAQARKAFENALELNPESFDAHLNLGLALARQGFVAEALPELHRSLALRPENPKALYNIGLAYHKMRLYESAQSYYERALKADPSMEKAALNLANLFVEQKQPDRAIQVLKAYIDTHPDAVDAVYNLAFLHLENGRPEDAERVVENAVARRPKLGPLWVIKAELLLRLGRHDAARAAVHEALRLSPKDPQALALQKRLASQP